ncbi:ABC transporter transmembrane region 2-domain-containing protein [Chytriomyces sp. MP71]|nr:ABC transporter transmembrane region 2-domain-containing protein [Chytriomyces sp. MP71]
MGPRIDRVFLRRLHRLLRIGFGRSGAVGWGGLLQVRLLVPLLITLSLVGEVVIYVSGTAVSAIYPSLATRDAKRFTLLIASMVVLYAIGSGITALREFATGLLGLCVRRALTRRMHRAYIRTGPLYDIGCLLKAEVPASGDECQENASSSEDEVEDEENHEEEAENDGRREEHRVLLGGGVNRRMKGTVQDREASLLDNPDQTIVQDIDQFSDMITKILTVGLTTPVLIIYYTYQVCIITETYFSAPFIWLFFFASWAVTYRAMNPVVPAVFIKEQKEGDLRYNHVFVRSETEAIAMMHSETAEKRRLDTLLDIVIDATYTVLRRTLPLKYCLTCTAYLGAVMSYLVISIPVFDGTFDGKTDIEITGLVAKNLFVCLYLINQFTEVTKVSEQLSQLSGFTARISLLLETCDKLDKTSDVYKETAAEAIIRRFRPSQKVEIPLLQVTNLSYSPPPKPLSNTKQDGHFPDLSRYDKLTFCIRYGQHTLITGPSGSGKSSLLRTLAHVWRHTSTRTTAITFDPDLLTSPADAAAANSAPTTSPLAQVHFDPEKVMFLPQQGFTVPFTPLTATRATVIHTTADPHPTATTYTPCLGPLAAQLTYPLHPVESGICDEDVARLLCLVGLEHLGARCVRGEPGVLEAMSAGERQRLQVARVLYWRPRLVFLDEGMSSLDLEWEMRLYGLLMMTDDAEEAGGAFGITVVAVSHSESNDVRRMFHQNVALG